MLATRIRLRQYLLASTFALVAMVSGCTTTSSIPIGGGLWVRFLWYHRRGLWIRMH